ncbi:MAG: ThuA domain-containing protein [Saprospiraceae bacterium]
MKKLAYLLLFALAGFLAYKFFFAKERFVSVLVFSKTAGFKHASIEAGEIALMDLGKKHGFRVDTTKNAAIFKEENLKNYNVVVFLNTTGDILDDAQQLEFNRFIQAGGGFVGIHAAADTEYDWTWYGKLVGAYFSSHPNNPNVREADIEVINADHASSSMLPNRWHCTDEWYNYKDINPNINVLLNLDETSYEGGTNGAKHPIAWYHEYDGGRSWYTGRGHTDESFSEPDFLAHLLGGINYAAGDGNRVNFNNASVAPDENRFTKVVLEDNLDEPMELEILPDGKLMYVQRHGAIRVYDPEEGSSSLVKRLNVFSDLEDGLLGMALDPNFEANNWVYYFYSDPEESHQNIARFTLNEDYTSLVANSEKILLKIPTQRDECCHSGGSLEFGPEGLLYISTGDNTSPRASDGFNPIDEQEGRSPWDAQKSSANMNDLRGKILRIKPETDGTYSLPTGNLFPADGSEGKPEIYVMGCRNPWRISIDQHTGFLYWGDVGPDANKDSLGRGSRGYDEVNQAQKAGFYGWPYFIADNKPYNRYDFAKKVSYEPYDVERPVNKSPNNTGKEVLPPATPAFIWYPYAASEEFPMVGDGSRNAMAGPVFYQEDYPANDNRFPDFYQGKLFTYDWMRGWIMAVTMDEAGNFKSMQRFLPSTKFSNPSDLIFGPNGDMYLLEYGTVWFSENPDARLVHLTYAAGNRKPFASVEADKKVGAAPLTVQLNADKSKDFDGDQLSYEWFIDEANTAVSTQKNFTHTFEQPGKHTAKLVIKDPSGEEAEANVEVLVGNELPKLNWEFTGNRSFYWDAQQLAYNVTVADAEDGTIGNGIDPSQVNISIDFLERGYDVNEIAMGHEAMMEASAFLLGKQLMDQSDCNTCHQLDVKSIGPTYQDIATKYKTDLKAEGYLAQKIINGGAGVWGEVAMAAHPQLSKSEASQMAKYILSLSGSSASLANKLSPKGTYVLNKHKTGNTEGKYILTASYTDKGGQAIGSLTARDVVVLQAPTINAANFQDLVKGQKFRITPEMSQGMVEEEFDLVIGMRGGHVLYKNIDFTGVKGLQFLVIKAGAFLSGGKLTLHLDDLEAPALAEIPVKMGLLDASAGTVSANIPATKGVHDLYVKFFNDGEDKPITGLITIYFSDEELVLEKS